VSRPRGVVIALAIVTGVVLLAVLAPAAPIARGSTYSRAPDGYGAWYAYMEQRGYDIRRWERPPFELLDRLEPGDPPATLIRVFAPDRATGLGLYGLDRQWVEGGNRLVALGVEVPPTAAAFATRPPSPVGPVLVQTTRRQQLDTSNLDHSDLASEPIVRDEFGAIAWRLSAGGEAIAVATPFLAANAYQDEPNNFALLASFVGEGPIWVDEYLHGYRDEAAGEATATDTTLIGYLLGQPPLAAALLQGAIVLAIALLAENRRFGAPQPLPSVETNSTRTYVTALGGVLRNARHHRFVTEVVGKTERIRLQRALGLGLVPVGDRELLAAWEHQGGNADELRVLLQRETRRRLSDAELRDWLARWQTVRRRLDS